MPRSGGRVRRDRAVHARGRFGRFAGGLRDYAQTAWWGLVSPRIGAARPLSIAQAVVLRQAGPRREILLTMRADLFGWELPGGTVEGDETPARALVRELREETGLEIAVERPVGDWVRTGFRPHTAHVLRARVVGGVLRPSHETPRVRWFDVSRLPDSLFPWYRAPIERALVDGLPMIAVREFQGGAAVLRAMRIDLVMRWRGMPKQVADPEEERDER